MGYFSSGSDGLAYTEYFCARCTHGTRDDLRCPVWQAHLDHNGDPNFAHVLDLMIPRVDGMNGTCAMFIDGHRPLPVPRPVAPPDPPNTTGGTSGQIPLADVIAQPRRLVPGPGVLPGFLRLVPRAFMPGKD